MRNCDLSEHLYIIDFPFFNRIENKTVEEEKLKRLLWHSRRGMLELDLVLMPFLEKHFANVSEADQALYEELLECEDQDLFKWFLGKEQPEDEKLRHIVNVIIDCVRAPKGSR